MAISDRCKKQMNSRAELSDRIDRKRDGNPC